MINPVKMNEKHTMSDEDAVRLIRSIKNDAGHCTRELDYFHEPTAVCEIVCSTLCGVGFDYEWVMSQFWPRLENEVKKNRDRIEEQEQERLEREWEEMRAERREGESWITRIQRVIGLRSI